VAAREGAAHSFALKVRGGGKKCQLTVFQKLWQLLQSKNAQRVHRGEQTPEEIIVKREWERK